MKANKIIVVDGFSDLPFSLGIPPFMSPEVRYMAGACWDRDDKARVIYINIDDLRAGRKSSLLNGADLVFVYAGVTEASPLVRPSVRTDDSGIAKVQDLVDYIAYLDCPKILGGPYVLAKNGVVDEKLGFDVIVTGDLSKYIHEILSDEGTIGKVDPSLQRNNEDLNRYAILGAGLAVQNPGYPSFLSCAVELYRGCPSASLGGCSFCHETKYTTVDYRPVEDVVAEIAKISELGCENVVFECPCFFSYFSSPNEEGKLDLDHSAIEKLLEGSRSVAPEIKGLHIMNINPGAIANDMDESRKILKSIRTHCSDGNFPNLRVVTFDDEVQLLNNTRTTAEQSRMVVKMIAEAGKGEGPSGLPQMLPTIELVYGLAGEGENTLELNLNNLKEFASKGLIRGVIVRKQASLPGTTISKRDDIVELEDFDKHMEILQEEVNRVAGGNLAAPGQLIRDVYPYRVQDGSAVAKKVGINPLDLLVHGVSQVNVLQDVRITSVDGDGMEAVAQPLIPKTVSREILRLVPEMTEERIDRFMQSRPGKAEDFYKLFEEPAFGRRAASYFDFKTGG